VLLTRILPRVTLMSHSCLDGRLVPIYGLSVWSDHENLLPASPASPLLSPIELSASLRRSALCSKFQDNENNQSLPKALNVLIL